SWRRTLVLAIQSIGVVYGDLGTSPLYVYSSTFPDGIHHTKDILGVLSLIIYTIVLISLIKYVFIVLRANDNGEGGTFALYSLLCRNANVSLIPKTQPEDRKLSNYKLELPSNETRLSQKIKEKMENSKVAKTCLFIATIMGTSMLIGDGILTPCISVLSAVSGIKNLSQDSIVWISIAILIALFMVQRFGTDKVGYTFSPVLCIWFLSITLIGVYNLVKHDLGVLRAFSPAYIVDYLKRTGHRGWISLGGVVLCITGTEAMFADLGHFNVPAIQISFSTIVFPSVLVAYIGQAAYLTKHPENVANTFYAATPDTVYWPMFVVANLAAVIASQSLISGAFSIISQSLGLGCFPRVKVVHTSADYQGQVYIPELNYILMVACVILTYGFKTTTQIGNAFGVAVISVMFITTSFLTLIMLVVWKTKIWKVILFVIVFMPIELIYLGACLYKFKEGAYLPLALAVVLIVLMAVWHYSLKQRYYYEMKHRVPYDYISELSRNPEIRRIPGIGLLYSELVDGVPQIFPHFISNIPAIHSVAVFVSIKSLPINRVEEEERFLIRQMEPRDFRVFFCTIRYGYRDAIVEPSEFESLLVENLKEFMRAGGCSSPETAAEEIGFVERARDAGVFYLIGEADVKAGRDSSLLKRFVVNKAYPFLRKNFRGVKQLLAIPSNRLVRVGMT
ncbi:hypothetical protein M569_07977, partial [Genlisea aurea]